MTGNSPEKALHEAAAVLADEVDLLPNATLSDPGVKDRLRAVLASSLSAHPPAVEDLAAQSLARMLVDAGGPSDAHHPVHQALKNWDRARARTLNGRLTPERWLTRQSLQDLGGRSRSVLDFWWDSFGPALVHVPMNVERSTMTRSLVVLTSSGGQRFVPVFTELDSLRAWVAGVEHREQIESRSSALSDIAAAAVVVGAGLVINPLEENVAFAHRYLGTRSETYEVRPGQALNVGRPSKFPPRLEAALRAWAENDRSVTSVFLAQLASEDRGARLLAAVGTNPPSSPKVWGPRLSRALSEGQALDLVDIESALGQAVQHSGIEIYRSA